MRTIPIAATSLLLVASLVLNATAQEPTEPGAVARVDATRWVMAHGRVDDVRSVGIQTPENPAGRVIPGITPNPPAAAGTPATALPPPSVLDVIAASPDPFNVTLDGDNDGKFDDPVANPLINAGTLVPSGFTLAVAHRNPGPPVAMQWVPQSPRFGAGNIYATVSIPAAGIVRGQELVTYEQYAAYTANSVIYEAPDVGLVIVDNNQDGGTENISSSSNKRTASRLIGFSQPLQTEIVEISQTPLSDGRKRFTVQAVSDNGAEQDANATYRWAIEAKSGTRIVDEIGVSTLSFELPFNVRPEDLPLKSWDEGMVKLTVVSSGWGPGVPAAALGNPFITPLPPAPQAVGLQTFISAASTLSDTHAMMCKGGTDEGPERVLDRSIVILIDASGSMKDNNKMEQAKASASRVLQRIATGTEVALIVFYDCGSIVVEHEFTSDPAPLLAILPRIQPSGGTPLAAGTTFAKEYMRKHASGKTLDLVILSDGEESCGGDPVAAAKD